MKAEKVIFVILVSVLILLGIYCALRKSSDNYEDDVPSLPVSADVTSPDALELVENPAELNSLGVGEGLYGQYRHVSEQ